MEAPGSHTCKPQHLKNVIGGLGHLCNVSLGYDSVDLLLGNMSQKATHIQIEIHGCNRRLGLDVQCDNLPLSLRR